MIELKNSIKLLLQDKRVDPSDQSNYAIRLASEWICSVNRNNSSSQKNVINSDTRRIRDNNARVL